jgi:hypothetical protein
MTRANKVVTSLVRAETVISIKTTPTLVKQSSGDVGSVKTAIHEVDSLNLLFESKSGAQQGTLEINLGG